MISILYECKKPRNMYKGIVLFGPPGVGKGTQAKLLAGDDYFHFSSGEMFRELDQSSRLGQMVSKIIDGGDMIDAHTTMELARQTLMRYRAHGNFDPRKQMLLLDGIPRYARQVNMINAFVDVEQVLNFYVPNEEILVERIIRRGEIEGRPDDNEETARKRLRLYHEKTEPMLKLYAPEIVVDVDGSGSREEIHHNVLENIVKI